MDAAQLIITVVSLILNALQAMWLAFLQVKFREYPNHPNGVVIVKDEQGHPEVTETHQQL